MVRGWRPPGVKKLSLIRENWVWSTFRAALTERHQSCDHGRSWCSGRVEDSGTQERERGSPVHLAFEHLDAVDVSFDDAGAVGQGEGGQYAVVVLLDTRDEGV